MSKTDTWLTPPEILAALGPFDLDPCASMGQPWATAARHFTINDNGLLQAWSGRVWLNPPYSNARPWAGRLAAHGTGTMLLFARVDTGTFFDFVYGCANLMMFLRGRLAFRDAMGQRRGRADEASVLIAYGDNDAERLAESGLDGALMLVGNDRQVVVALPTPSWRDVIAGIFQRHGSELSLQRLYALVEDEPKAQSNPHWQAKVRQQVQRAGFARVAPGVYRMERAA